jgi:formylglycine-generating enzyme required for sulfatase activity
LRVTNARHIKKEFFVKNFLKLFGVIALAAVIVFSMIACGGGGGGGSQGKRSNPVDPDNPGDPNNPGGQTPGTKSNPTVTWPQGLTAVYGQTLSAISLASYTNSGTAGAFSWTTPSGSVGSYGARSHSMTFTPSDTANYNTVTYNVSVIVSAEMVHVTGGTFTMGSPTDEANRGTNETQWQVALSAFSIGKYEVTQEQYETVMGTNPSNFKTNAASGETQNKRPVEQVSWYDALVFCNKLSVAEGLTPAYRISGSTDPAAWGTVPTSSNATWNAVTVVSGSTGYRLPTEAQWEYAARGGQSANNSYKIYSGSNTVGDVAWYSVNSGSKTHEVGTKAANELGLHDMSGNVYEWCWDWYGTYPTAAQTDPVGASSGSSRMRRGGRWSAAAQYARSAYRDFGSPYLQDYNLGFRLVRPAQ